MLDEGFQKRRRGGISEAHLPDVVIDCIEQRRGSSRSFLTQTSRWIILPDVKL